MRNAFGAPSTALVLGGASDIAWAALERLADRGLESAVLAARSPSTVKERLDDSRLGLSAVHVLEWNAVDADTHEKLIVRAQQLVGDLDVVLCAVGSLGDDSGPGWSVSNAIDVIASNYTGPAAALLAAANELYAQRHGCIVVLSSVAGARPRRSNFIYGSAKSGIDAFAQGLRDSLHGSGINIHIVRPGFVHSKMTAGMPPAPFAATVDEVAKAIEKVTCSRTSRIAWVPPLLGPLFLGLRNLPAPLWRAISKKQ